MSAYVLKIASHTHTHACKFADNHRHTLVASGAAPCVARSCERSSWGQANAWESKRGPLRLQGKAVGQVARGWVSSVVILWAAPRLSELGGWLPRMGFTE